MPTLISLDLEHLSRLPQHPSDVWQLGVFRLPVWVADRPGGPYRPRVPICRSVETGRVEMGEGCAPGEPEESGIHAALARLSRQGALGYRPATVHTSDGILAERLRPALAEAGIPVELVERLEMLDEVLAGLGRRFAGAGDALSYLDGPGVTLEGVRAFADAAAAFYRAAPWNHLANEDLIRVVSPAPEARLRHFVVLGQGGIRRGIGFHPSAADHRRMLGSEDETRIPPGTRWCLTLDPVDQIPFADADLWEAHRLPLAAPSAYPSLMGFRGDRVLRADATVLDYVEGLLRAMAESTEDDLDRGRWKKAVRAHGGERVVELALPAQLAAEAGPRRAQPPGIPDRRLHESTMRDIHRLLSEREFGSPEEANAYLATLVGRPVPHRVAETREEERAQELCDDALRAVGRLRIKRAREALALWPDCADALVLLAEEMPDAERSRELHRRAMEAAARVLGAERFERDAGHFWAMLDTRPYMRARAGLAASLWEDERDAEAVEHWKELLRLNPGDNQGIRFRLVACLLELRRDEEAAQVLAGFAEDRSASLAYARALIDFRRGGEAEAKRALERAIRFNPHVLKYLAGSAPPPDALPDSYRLGGEDEAARAADELIEVWEATPGARAWLQAFRREAKRERKRKSRKR